MSQDEAWKLCNELAKAEFPNKKQRTRTNSSELDDELTNQSDFTEIADASPASQSASIFHNKSKQSMTGPKCPKRSLFESRKRGKSSTASKHLSDIMATLKSDAIRKSHSQLADIPDTQQAAKRQDRAKKLQEAYMKASAIFDSFSDSQSQDVYQFTCSPAKFPERISDSEHSRHETHKKPIGILEQRYSNAKEGTCSVAFTENATNPFTSNVTKQTVEGLYKSAKNEKIFIRHLLRQTFPDATLKASNPKASGSSGRNLLEQCALDLITGLN